MRAGFVVGLLIALAAGGVCTRLGLWQVSRWHEKQARNAALRAALAAEPALIAEPLPVLAAVEDRRIEMFGSFDESRQVLLSAREQAELPGVEVVTPLLLAGDSVAVLVNRGWLYAPDQVHARPQDYREKSPRAVRGLARALGRRGAGLPCFTLESDSLHSLWSARTLDPDTLAARFPYALAPWVLVELPGKGVPEKPLRSSPRPLDETMHLSYAIQWFLFATIVFIGTVALAVSRFRARPRPRVLPPLEPLR
jgi:surfeit locus 1 family protein